MWLSVTKNRDSSDNSQVKTLICKWAEKQSMAKTTRKLEAKYKKKEKKKKKESVSIFAQSFRFIESSCNAKFFAVLVAYFVV